MQEAIMSEVNKIFGYLGLDEKSAQFYLSCLESGKTTINEVAKNIKAPRSSCYLILERLKKEGLIFETPFGRKRTLVAQNPERLKILLEKRKEESENVYGSIKQILSTLNSISQIPQRQKVRYYEGFESIKQIYNETLESKLIHVFCLTQNNSFEFKEFIDKYMNRLKKKGIETKELVTDTDYDIEYRDEFSTQKNKIVCVPKEYIANTDYMLWDDKVAFISFKNGRYTGIVIEDQEIASFEKNRFTLLWKMFTKKN